jgi:hypothetical protein
MSIAKPTVVPSWASVLSNDPTTGQPNRVEPSSGKKITGFNFNEKPPRQDMNWLHWNQSQWINWLQTIMANMDQPVFMSPGHSYIYYEHIANKLSLIRQAYDAVNYNTQLVNTILDTSNTYCLNPGFIILEKSFRRPNDFSKLNLTYIAKSNLYLGSGRRIITAVLNPLTTVDNDNWDIVASHIDDENNLYTGGLKSIQLNLGSTNAGDPLHFIQAVSFPSIGSLSSDFTVETGQLYSSWSN